MGTIHRGDEGLHHCDWSHRWSGGPADEAGQAAWQAALREHMADHRRQAPPPHPDARPHAHKD